jgi:hypothetical protein
MVMHPVIGVALGAGVIYVVYEIAESFKHKKLTPGGLPAPPAAAPHPAVAAAAQHGAAVANHVATSMGLDSSGMSDAWLGLSAHGSSDDPNANAGSSYFNAGFEGSNFENSTAPSYGGTSDDGSSWVGCDDYYSHLSF